MNLFIYARNNPIALKDLDGRWSSKGNPFDLLVQPVHQMAIERVLSTQVDKRSLSILTHQQDVIDSRQEPKDQYLHAMTGKGLSKQQAIADANAFVHNEIISARQSTAEANSLQPKIKELKQEIARDSASPKRAAALGEMNDRLKYLTGQQQNLKDAAMVHLGNAIHTLQDATSPSHKGFQTYDDPVPHALEELQYPEVGSSERKQLQAATQWGYEMYNLGEMPENIFDKNGTIMIPREIEAHAESSNVRNTIFDIFTPRLVKPDEESMRSYPGMTPDQIPGPVPSVVPVVGPRLLIRF